MAPHAARAWASRGIITHQQGGKHQEEVVRSGASDRRNIRRPDVPACPDIARYADCLLAQVCRLRFGKGEHA